MRSTKKQIKPSVRRKIWNIWKFVITISSSKNILLITGYNFFSLILLSPGVGGHFCPRQILIKINSEWLVVWIWNFIAFPNLYYRLFCWEKKFKKTLNFQGVTVLVAELNIYMYKKLLVLHHLIFSKDYIAYFADQLL